MVKINLIDQNKVASTVSTAGIRRAAETGQAIGNLLDAEQQRQNRINQASIDAEVGRANSQLNLNLNNSLNSTRNSFKNKPEQGEKAYVDNINSQIDSIASSLSTPAAQEAFKAQSFKYADTYKAKVNNWASTQKIANVGDNMAATNESYSNQAYSLGKDGNFTDFDTMLLAQQDSISKALPALGTQQGKEMSQTAINNSVTQFLGGMTRTNPVGAQQALRSGRYDNILSEKERDSLLDQSAIQLSSNLNKDNNLKQKNPYGWVEIREGSAPAINFNNEKELQNSLLDRKFYVDSNQMKYPDVDMGYLNDAEVEFIKEGIATSTPQESVEFMNMLNINMPNQMINQVSRQLFKKDASLGAAFAISDENPNLAFQAIQGRTLVKNKSVPELPSEKDLNIVYQDTYGNSIRDTELLDQVLTSARSIYASHIFNGGNVDEDAYKDILKQVIGDSASINGAKTTTFRDMNNNIVSGGQLEEYFDTDIIESDNNLNNSDFINNRIPFPLAGDKPINAEQIVKYGQLESVGDGLYNIRFVTNNRYLLDANGNPYQLDMKTIYNGRLNQKMVKAINEQQKRMEEAGEGGVTTSIEVGGQGIIPTEQIVF